MRRPRGRRPAAARSTDCGGRPAPRRRPGRAGEDKVIRTSRLCPGLAVLVLLMLPAAAHAQSSGIAGVVKDTTGAVLPGVNVEASSPALIEKSRTVITDAQG